MKITCMHPTTKRFRADWLTDFVPMQREEDLASQAAVDSHEVRYGAAVRSEAAIMQSALKRIIPGVVLKETLVLSSGTCMVDRGRWTVDLRSCVVAPCDSATLLRSTTINEEIRQDSGGVPVPW